MGELRSSPSISKRGDGQASRTAKDCLHRIRSLRWVIPATVSRSRRPRVAPHKNECLPPGRAIKGSCNLYLTAVIMDIREKICGSARHVRCEKGQIPTMMNAASDISAIMSPVDGASACPSQPRRREPMPAMFAISRRGETRRVASTPQTVSVGRAHHSFASVSDLRIVARSVEGRKLVLSPLPRTGFRLHRPWRQMLVHSWASLGQ